MGPAWSWHPPSRIPQRRLALLGCRGVLCLASMFTLTPPTPTIVPAQSTRRRSPRSPRRRRSTNRRSAAAGSTVNRRLMGQHRDLEPVVVGIDSNR
eukprot:scaffold2901_cov99-Isochrysis_galbana.AAC.7